MNAEVNALLQNAGHVINLEISFEAPPGERDVSAPQCSKLGARRVLVPKPRQHGLGMGML